MLRSFDSQPWTVKTMHTVLLIAKETAKETAKKPAKK